MAMYHGNGGGQTESYKALSSSKDLREGMEMCLHALEVTQATRLLMDLLKMRLVLVDDERWLAEDLLPRVAKTALRRIAGSSDS